MVHARRSLVSNKLGIKQLRAVIGSSYGGRLPWQWAIQYPNEVKGIIPVIASPCTLAGRRGMQYSLGIEPLLIGRTWDGSNYQEPPRNFSIAIMAYWIFTSEVNNLRNDTPTRELSLRHPRLAAKIAAKLDTNDGIYQLRANDGFNASLALDLIQTQVLAIAIDGDEMAPAELGQLEETRLRPGKEIEVILAKDFRGVTAALQHEIEACAPKTKQFLKTLDQ